MYNGILGAEHRSSSAPGWPIVSLSPNWTTVYQGEPLTLTCHTESTVQKNLNYSWYKDNLKMNREGRSFTIVKVNPSDSGEYQCLSDTSEKSDPVTLTVTNGE
ncbi:hypothetical protein GDO86_016553 [Hymenochirus boettgeri]|uniref:Ig-like domain-containing protein n=1 Tax=Hymenochirus boettgeri TaxID=247094 RepID=A0A8T2JXI6_9PIPI|nr:hypothetical protein GDO86_016553 [Hymenochirus boettgeri]